MKAERIRSSALAPADPSPADRAVASQATQMASQARAQIMVEKQQEAQSTLEKMKASSQADDTRSSTETVGTAKPAFSAAESALDGPQSVNDVAEAVQDRQSGISFSSNLTREFFSMDLELPKNLVYKNLKGSKGIEAFKPNKTQNGRFKCTGTQIASRGKLQCDECCSECFIPQGISLLPLLRTLFFIGIDTYTVVLHELESIKV